MRQVRARCATPSHTLINTSSNKRVQLTSPRRCFLVRCHYTIKRKPSGNRLSTTSCLLLWRLPHFCSCRFPHNFAWVNFLQTRWGGGKTKSKVWRGLRGGPVGRTDTPLSSRMGQRAPCSPNIWQQSTFERWMDVCSCEWPEPEPAALKLVSIQTKYINKYL